MTPPRPSWLISSVGWINVLIGLVFIGFGVYVLIAGADAVSSLFQLKTDVGKAADKVVGQQHGQQVEEAAGLFAKGLSGVIVAFALVIASCSILQGLPNLLVGVGVLLRSNFARVFAIVFAVLALLEGIGCLTASGQSNTFVYLGLVLLAYAVLTFVALLGKRASIEFSGGLQQVTTTAQETQGEVMATPQAERPVAVIVLSVLLVGATAAASIFGTLYYTARPGVPLAHQPIGNDKGGDQKPSRIDDTTTLAAHKPRLAAFHDAVLAGQVPRAAEMLKQVDVDEPDEHGRTALMKACATGNVRAAMFLIAMGAQVNQADRDGRTPIMHAAETNQLAVLDVLFGEGTAPTEIAAIRAQYFDASKGGIGANLKELVGAKFMPTSPRLDVRDKKGLTAMMIAILKGHPDAANQIGRPGRGGQPDRPVDGNGDSIVHLLAADGNIRMLRHFGIIYASPPFWAYYKQPGGGFVWSACDQNTANNAGREPWMVAAEKGHLEAVKHLLHKPVRTDLERKDNSGKTGLALAQAGNHAEVVAFLTQLQSGLTKRGDEKK